jgi:hypothetical protein
MQHLRNQPRFDRAISLRKQLASGLLALMSLFTMLRKAVAAALLTLVASPFTAPFETCNFSALFGDPTTLASIQIQSALSIEEDSHAVVPRSAARGLRMGLKLIFHASTETTRTCSPAVRAGMPLAPLPLETRPQPSPPSQRPLRI